MWDVLVNWLNQNLGAAQTIATMALVLFAAWQGILAHRARNDTTRLAQAAKIQADASVRMADEMREQRYDRYRPIIIVQQSASKLIVGRQGYDRVEATISNIGEGPALKLSFSFDTGDKRLLPHALVRVKDVDEFDKCVEAAEFSPVPVSLDEPMELGSRAEERFAFYGTEGTNRRGVIPFGTRGRFVAEYVDVFGREFQSVLPAELLEPQVGPWVRVGPLSLTEGSKVRR